MALKGNSSLLFALGWMEFGLNESVCKQTTQTLAESEAGKIN